MRYLQNYTIFEKSSLTALNVPNEVMKIIQYEYEIQSDAKWNKIQYKKDVKDELKNDEISLFLEMNKKYIKIIVNLGNNNYVKQSFMYDDSGWGAYDVRERMFLTRTQMLIGVDPKSTIYKLDGDFQHKPKVKRLIQKEMKRFDKITTDFKFHMLYNFNSIIQRIYGRRFDTVMNNIATNIKNLSPNASADEILQFLTDNKKMAEKAREYDIAKEEDDILKIKKLEKKYNSLPVLDEYLIKFEEEFSEKYNTRLSISDLIDEFGNMKIETAFMYYLFTGKLKELSVQKHK